MHPTTRSAIRTTALLSLLAVGAMAQVRADEPPRIDPYTQDQDEALVAAGYVSFGPFPFGTNHGSDDIAALLPDEPLLWIETGHFRIGCALPALPLASAKDKEWQGKVREELLRLARRLPNVNPQAATLDPWLRAHLVAQRAEEVYDDVLQQLGCDDTDFPAAPGDSPRSGVAYRGLGPFLGLPQKYTILLLQRSASLQRYTAAYQSWSTASPVRHHDHKFGMAFFGACEQSDGGLLRHDLALRTHLAFHVAHNLYTGFRSYGHNLPAWVTNGLAWRHARRVSARFPIFDLRTADDPDGKRYATWAKRGAALLHERRFEPLARFLERMDVGTFTMDDHLQSWALVDWLLAQHPGAFVEYLRRMKDPFHERLRFPTDDELLARQRTVVRRSFGVDAAGLEELWRRQPLAVAKR